MPKICAVSTALPPYRVTQQESREFARTIFGGRMQDIDRLLPVFDNAGIESRYFSKPIEWFCEPHTLSEKNNAYLEGSTQLSTAAVEDLLSRTNTKPDDIDYIIYVNTTGLATPSIETRLINRLGMRHDVRRTPIWGLGCAGGAAGLSHAYHHLLGHPTQRVLLVAVELCGLTFIREDYSRSNLVACALFGEGAAAVLLTGDQVDGSGLEIIDTKSRLYPDSLDVMGWNVVAEGLQVVFAQRIPDIVAATAADDFRGFLAQHDLTLADIAEYLVHPGGRKVLEAYERALAVSNGRLSLGWEILRDYGNMSSVTVLFVLRRFLGRHATPSGTYGLISALGPGFCSESLLVRL